MHDIGPAKHPCRFIAILYFLTATTLFFAEMPVTSYAAPGDLDQTFGIGGKLTDWPGSERAQGVAIQPDGKIIIVGAYPFVPGDRDFRIARYNPDGTPDITFGGGTGRVTTDFGGYDDANNVLIQPDGSMLVAGTSTRWSISQGGLAIARYNPDGSLDAGFGGGSGKVLTEAPCWDAHFGSVGDVAIQPNGKIVAVAGMGDGDENCESDGLLVRYHPDGSLDTSFGSNGAVSTDYGLWFVTLQRADGKIVAGLSDRIARFNTNGSLDPGFGSGGIVTLPIHFETSGGSVGISAAGKIVAAGYYTFPGPNYPKYDLALFRFNVNGSPDTSFDGDGVVTTHMGSSDGFGSSVAVQSNGMIVAAGTSINGSIVDFALARYNTDGSLDSSFGGGDGITTLDFGNSTEDHALDVALDSQGRAVVVGGSGGMFAIARFLLAPRPTRFDFDGDGRADISVFRPSDTIWHLNRSTAGFAATQFGLSTDKITPADYDGDGKTDIAVFRDGTWYWLGSVDGSFHAFQFGTTGDVPVPADFTGGGRSELAVYRSGVWWMVDLSNSQVNAIQFGISTDKSVVADYDGDGRADQAVYRGNGEWHLNRSSLGYTAINFGLASDRPVVGDYDGDGCADQAVYRDGTWYLLRSTQGFAAVQFGIASDIPAPADYDGDGKTDLAVYRDGIWYLLQSTSGFAVTQFGLPNDKPVPSAYLP